MIKRLITLLCAMFLSFTLVACDGDKASNSKSSTSIEEKSTEETLSKKSSSEATSTAKDTIPPAFIGATDGKLSTIEHNKDEEVDLLHGVIARDNLTKDENVVVKVTVLAGYDKSIPGKYTITIQAEDTDGNKTTVLRDVTVIDKIVNTLNSVSFGGEQAPYQYNEKDALSYTSSGTKFRSKDIIQVMTKEFFIEEYNKHSANHTNNASIPYFPNGVLLVVNKDMKVRQIRIAAGENIQIDADGTVKTSELTWTNAIESTDGGGLFKGFITDIEAIIPDGGYVIFVGNTSPEVCRKFLISSLLYSGYTGGGVSASNQDIDVTNLKIELKNK